MLQTIKKLLRSIFMPETEPCVMCEMNHVPRESGPCMVCMLRYRPSNEEVRQMIAGTYFDA